MLIKKKWKPICSLKTSLQLQVHTTIYIFFFKGTQPILWPNCTRCHWAGANLLHACILTCLCVPYSIINILCGRYLAMVFWFFYYQVILIPGAETVESGGDFGCYPFEFHLMLTCCIWESGELLYAGITSYNVEVNPSISSLQMVVVSHSGVWSLNHGIEG